MPRPAVQAPVQPGDVLAEKYLVERVLGAGTMGVVVAARHTQLGQRVALKFLRKEIAERPDVVARFLREARTGAQIKGEHTARILDVGTMEGGLPYMVMEFLEGRDLNDLLAERGSLRVDEAVEYVVQACIAIAEAHAVGVVHRDLKPSNLFLTSRPDGSPLVKVLDFGISKVTALGDQGTDLTQTEDVIGSPMYMSPEHARSARSVDMRTDIWSLGVILHQLLAGEPPFRGESIGELLSAILVMPPKRLRVTRPDVPPALEAIVLQCLEKDVALRIPSATELARALGPWAHDDTRALIARAAAARSAPPPHPTPSVSDRPTSEGEAATSMGWQPGILRPTRSRLLLASAVLAGVASVAFVSLRLVHGSGGPRPVVESASSRPSPGAVDSEANGSIVPLEQPAEQVAAKGAITEEPTNAPREPSVPVVTEKAETPSRNAQGAEDSHSPTRPTRARPRIRPTVPPTNATALQPSSPSPVTKPDFRSLIDERR